MNNDNSIIVIKPVSQLKYYLFNKVFLFPKFYSKTFIFLIRICRIINSSFCLHWIENFHTKEAFKFIESRKIKLMFLEYFYYWDKMLQKTVESYKGNSDWTYNIFTFDTLNLGIRIICIRYWFPSWNKWMFLIKCLNNFSEEWPINQWKHYTLNLSIRYIYEMFSRAIKPREIIVDICQWQYLFTNTWFIEHDVANFFRSMVMVAFATEVVIRHKKRWRNKTSSRYRCYLGYVCSHIHYTWRTLFLFRTGCERVVEVYLSPFLDRKM